MRPIIPEISDASVDCDDSSTLVTVASPPVKRPRKTRKKPYAMHKTVFSDGRQRLDHLTESERAERRRAQNRVASVSWTKRRTLKLKELEGECASLRSENATLVKSNVDINVAFQAKQAMFKLECANNTKLTAQLESSQADNTRLNGEIDNLIALNCGLIQEKDKVVNAYAELLERFNEQHDKHE